MYAKDEGCGELVPHDSAYHSSPLLQGRPETKFSPSAPFMHCASYGLLLPWGMGFLVVCLETRSPFVHPAEGGSAPLCVVAQAVPIRAAP